MASLVSACYYALGWVGQKLALPYFTGALVFKYSHYMLPTGSFLGDYLQRWSRDDLATVTRKMASLSSSRLTCSVNFLKRAIILLSEYASNVSDSDLDRQLDFLQQMDQHHSKLWDVKLSNRLKDLLTRSEAWAAEAFYDKANVDVEGRVEALKVQFLCVLLLHKDNQAEVLSLWNAILEDVLVDREMMDLIGQKPKSWNVFSKQWKGQQQREHPAIIRSFFEFVERLKSTLLNYRHENAVEASVNRAVLNLWNTLLTFDPSPDHQVVRDYSLVITVPTSQFCVLPKNRTCTLGNTVASDELCMRIWFNNKVERELNVGQQIRNVDSLLRYSVAYDQKRDAVLLSCSTFMALYSANFANGQPLLQYDFDDTIGRNAKTIVCTEEGVWFMCDEFLCKFYVKWYKNGGCQWKNVRIGGLDLNKFDTVTLMDIRDADKGDVEKQNLYECVEILLKITRNNNVKFMWSMIKKDDSDEEVAIVREIDTNNTPTSSTMTIAEQCLVPVFSYTSQWMVFESRCENDTILLLRSEDKTSLKITRLKLDNSFIMEYSLSNCSLPNGIRQAACRLPYVFVANKLHPS